MTTDTLQKEFGYYRAHQDEMVEKYDGLFIVIKDQQVIGVFDSDVAAVIQTEKVHTLGTFLVQKVSAGVEAYTVSIASPGMLA